MAPTQSNRLSALPDELHSLSLSYLDPKSVSRVSRTSKTQQALTEDFKSQIGARAFANAPARFKDEVTRQTTFENHVLWDKIKKVQIEKFVDQKYMDEIVRDIPTFQTVERFVDTLQRLYRYLIKPRNEKDEFLIFGMAHSVARYRSVEEILAFNARVLSFDTFTRRPGRPPITYGISLSYLQGLSQSTNKTRTAVAHLRHALNIDALFGPHVLAQYLNN